MLLAQQFLKFAYSILLRSNCFDQIGQVPRRGFETKLVVYLACRGPAENFPGTKR